MIFVPYNVDIQMPRVPIANWVLIGATCVASLVFLADPESHLDMLLWRGKGFEFGQLFTHLFAHADLMHLIGNMVMLFVFGNAVNARLGHLLYLGLYVTMGALAGLAWLAVDQGRASLGASGAIMGVIGIFLVYYPRNDVSVFWWLMYRAGTVSFSSYFLILAYILFDLLAFTGKSKDHVAHMSHLGGAAAGVAFGTVMALTGLVKPGDGEQTIFQAMKEKPRRSGARRDAPRGATPFRPPPEEPRRKRGEPPPGPKMPAPPPGGWR